MSYHFVHRSKTDIGIWDKIVKYADYYKCTSQKYRTLKEMVNAYEAVMNRPVPNFYQDDVFLETSDDIFDEYADRYTIHNTEDDRMVKDYDIGTLSDNQLLEILDQSEVDPPVLNLGLFQDSSKKE